MDSSSKTNHATKKGTVWYYVGADHFSQCYSYCSTITVTNRRRPPNSLEDMIYYEFLTGACRHIGNPYYRLAEGFNWHALAVREFLEHFRPIGEADQAARLLISLLG